MRAWPARNPNTISGGEPTIAWSRVGGEPTQCTRLGNCKELITAMTSMDSTLLVVNLRITLQRHGDGSFDRAEGACWNITSPTQFDPMGSSSHAPHHTIHNRYQTPWTFWLKPSVRLISGGSSLYNGQAYRSRLGQAGVPPTGSSW